MSASSPTTLRDALLATLDKEAHAVRHLVTKVSQEMLDYRPTESQRSMQELLGYLVHGPVQGLSFALGTREDPDREAVEKAAEGVTLATFAEQLDRSVALQRKWVETVDDEALLTRAVDLPWAKGVLLARGLNEFWLAFWVAYRMQLFLYLKSCGRSELTTGNGWAGLDPEKKKDAVAS